MCVLCSLLSSSLCTEQHLLLQREIEDLSAKVHESQELLEKEKEVKQRMEVDCRNLENNLQSEKVLGVSDVRKLCRNDGSYVGVLGRFSVR